MYCQEPFARQQQQLSVNKEAKLSGGSLIILQVKSVICHWLLLLKPLTTNQDKWKQFWFYIKIKEKVKNGGKDFWFFQNGYTCLLGMKLSIIINYISSLCLFFFIFLWDEFAQETNISIWLAMEITYV